MALDEETSGKKISTEDIHGDGEEPDLLANILTIASLFLIVITFPVSVFICIKLVHEYERAVLFKLGKMQGKSAKGPGVYFIIPCIDTFVKMDMRTTSLDIPPQEILTRDAVTLSVDAVVYYRVIEPTAAIGGVRHIAQSLRLVAGTSIRSAMGVRELQDLLSDRQSAAKATQSLLEEATETWGIRVERVEIKDFKLPELLQKSMAAEADASREARAKVIAAEGEQMASRALKEAADVIVESPAALQLRYLQTLRAMSADGCNTVVVAVPLELAPGDKSVSGTAAVASGFLLRKETAA